MSAKKEKDRWLGPRNVTTSVFIGAFILLYIVYRLLQPSSEGGIVFSSLNNFSLHVLAIVMLIVAFYLIYLAVLSERLLYKINNKDKRYEELVHRLSKIDDKDIRYKRLFQRHKKLLAICMSTIPPETLPGGLSSK